MLLCSGPNYLKFLAAIIFSVVLVSFFSCANSGNDFLSSDERALLGAQETVIDVLFGYEEAPYSFYNEDGEYVGLLVDYMKEIEEIIGYEFNFKYFKTWANMLDYSKISRNFIIIGIARTESREKYLKFTNSLTTIPYVVVAQKGSGINSFDELSERSVVSVRQYAVNDYLAEKMPDLSFAEVDSVLDGVRAVSSGDYEAMVMSQLVFSYIIHEQYITNLRIAGASGFINHLYVAVSDQDSILFGIIDKAVTQIKPKIHEDLFRKWVNAGEPIISKRHLNFMIAAAGTAIGIIFLSWIWLVSLRSQVSRKTMQVKESESIYRALIDNSHEAIYLRRHNSFVLTNKRFEELFGYSLKEIKAKEMALVDFTVDEERDAFVVALKQTDAKNMEPVRFEFTGKTRDGSKPTIEAAISYFMFDDGWATQGILRDVSERKLWEKELVDSKEKAEESDRLKSAFLANMGHEIRTPMNGILGFSKLLTNPDLSSDQREVYTDIIQQSGQRMLNTVNDLVDISMIKTNQVQLNYTSININQKLESFLTFFCGKLTDKQITLSYTVDLSDDEALLFTDESKIDFIIGNLLNNACKYTEKGTIVYGYNLCSEDNKILFYVKDSGIGIEPQQIDRIFSRFVQLDSSYTRSYEGSGLGLAITKSYTEFLGGKLWVESIPGQGSTFYFTLPFRSV